MHPRNHTVIIVLYFFLTLFCILGIVEGVRIVHVWQKTVFDGEHQFVLGTRGHDPTEVFVIRPDTQEIDTLIFRGESDATHLFTSAGVFIDAVVPYDSFLDPQDLRLGSYLRHHIFSQNTGLNSIDMLGLWWFEKRVKKKLFYQSTHAAVAQILVDKTLYQEGKTVAVVNASSLSGKGSKLAAALTAIGANVISVTTATVPENTSFLRYGGKRTYTVRKLSRIIPLPRIQAQNVPGLADITIVLGKDVRF